VQAGRWWWECPAPLVDKGASEGAAILGRLPGASGGSGMMDDLRIDGLWRICRDGLRFPGKRTKLQEYILWRRVAGGLSGERQEILLASEQDKLRQQKNAPLELIRMAGSFERIGRELKAELIERFMETVVALASEEKHCAPYLAALGLLLTRTPLYAGPENIVAPSFVEGAYEAFRRFDWSDPEFVEAQTLFLRAARAVDERRLDAPKSLRNQIADRLQKCGIPQVKVERVRHFVPSSERNGSVCTERLCRPG